MFHDVLPQMHARWKQRNAQKRPLPPALAWATDHFSAVYAVDGSTLDALMRKVGLLREDEKTPLAGRMAALLDLGSRLPHTLWYEASSTVHDQSFWERILAHVQRGSLLIFDLGFFNFAMFDRLGTQGVSFITRAKTNTRYKEVKVLSHNAWVRDCLITLGSGRDSGKTRCEGLMRLVEVYNNGRWYRYVTNVIDPADLPATMVLALDWQRWRIEDAFGVVKRLLGLSYFWVGSSNGVAVPMWATWLLYGVLVDLTDEVALALNEPFAALSLEMVFHGLYHFTQAHHRGQAHDPVLYLAQHAKKLGILKPKRPSSLQELLYLTKAT